MTTQKSAPATAATTRDGQERPPVALAGLRVDARIDGAMSEVRIEQSYRNAEDKPIEAVYTFPLPSGAVLLDIGVEVGDRRLRGSIQRVAQARDAYEKAIEDGDGAYMLEQAEPGLFTLNAGNLRPGETARVSFAYAILNRWSGDRLRFLLPTTVAPRYGDWRIAPHAIPEADLHAENRFSLRVSLGQDLREARISCPSHRLEARDDGGARDLVLAGETAAMDRDFVLEIRHAQPRPGFALLGHGPEGVVALASFQPFMPGLERRVAVDAVAVIDCSGSMAGSSIDQARKALRSVVDRLEEHDRLGVICFGSSTRPMPGGRKVGDARGVAALRGFVDAIDADLGGTEIEAALQEAIAMARGGARPADIFLVTDGEVAGWEVVVKAAKAAGVRIFVVGVGHAASEAFLATLAEKTGGACELVTPDEAMAERVARHFERMRAPRATDVAIAWPAGATHLAPASPAAIFAGDTVHAHARLADTAAPGQVALEFATEDGVRHRQRVELSGPVAEGTDGRPSTVARLAAAARLASLPEEEATELALSHQLLSAHTAWVVVDERVAAGKTDGMPALRPVHHMLAAGWGGTGVASAHMAMSASAPTFADLSPATSLRSPLPMRLEEAEFPSLFTRRDSILSRIRAMSDPREIARALGFDGELSGLMARAGSPFQAELVANAFAAALLDGIAGADPGIGSLARRFARQVDAMMERLVEVQALVDQARHGVAEIAPRSRGALEAVLAELREGLKLADIARHEATALHARLDEPAS
ncbi:MAG: VIT and vWA domain-containing protein [Alphaproteobacteria bacterium]